MFYLFGALYCFCCLEFCQAVVILQIFEGYVYDTFPIPHFPEIMLIDHFHITQFWIDHKTCVQCCNKTIKIFSLEFVSVCG